jgi:ankyrin repeat protein
MKTVILICISLLPLLVPDYSQPLSKGELSGIPDTSAVRSLSGRSDERKLFNAIYNNNIIEVRSLIDNGGDINKHSKTCYPLLAAVCGGSREIVDLLLKSGARIDTCTSHTIMQLLSYPATYQQILEWSGMSVAYNPVYYAIKAKRLDILQTFEKYGYDFTVKMGASKYTYPFIAAAKFGDDKILDYLLGKKADYKVKDSEGNNALMLACSSNNPLMVNRLLTMGYDVNDTSKSGSSALMYAAKVKDISLQLIDSLISHGADNGHINRYNQSALSMACSNNNRVLANILMAHGARAKNYTGDFQTDAFTNHFLADYYLSSDSLVKAKAFYLQAKHFYEASVEVEKHKLEKIKREQRFDRLLGIATYMSTGNSVQRDVSSWNELHNYNTSTVYEEEPPFTATTEEFASYYSRKIGRFEASVKIIDAVTNCIGNGLKGNELDSCIKKIDNINKR